MKTILKLSEGRSLRSIVLELFTNLIR